MEINSRSHRKFGKQIQKLQLELPDYSASFVNYKALKKLIKKLSVNQISPFQFEVQDRSINVTSEEGLQVNKASFLFQFERELEKVNALYVQKEAELQIRLKTLLEKKKVLKSKNHITSRRFAKFTTLEEGFQQFVNDLNKLQQLVEVNGIAFSKILKKWDKISKSKTKELYISRAVEIQPFFNPTVISELSDQATTSLQELGAWSEGDYFSFDRNFDHMVSSQHLLGTDEGDTDTLLLETVKSGNLGSLKDLLSRLKNSVQSNSSRNSILRERITRTFLTAINRGPQESLQLLIDTGLVDLQSEDDINERNCLHQAAIYGNLFVLKEGLKGGVAVSRADAYGQIPLHYACMHGHLDMVETLLDSDPSTIDFIDHDRFTPLIHAIRRGHFDCVEHLILRSARIDPSSDTDHVPLNLACDYGSVSIVELLLKHGAEILSDVEGLFPQHLVARSGKTPELLLLLKQHNADLNQVDKLYSWTPLFHAASEGNVLCIRILLDVGVQLEILDEKGLSAMYYAAWEGHLDCMQLISSASICLEGIQNTHEPAQNFAFTRSSIPESASVDIDTIPELELPPPIIPLRRYGHSFLDTKTLIKISFDGDDHQPLTFFHDCKYPAARLTISSKVSDLIPKNILLPFQDDTKTITFQIDNLETFTIDFDVFPTYGAKVIAKTVALPHTFRSLMCNFGRCCLPLFDPRLRVIGQITFKFQVIKPFQGKPLEITDFQTYWKATCHLTHKPNSLVTDSSLSGDYIQLFVQQLSDGVPVLWPKGNMNHMGIEFPISCMTYEQFIYAGSRQAKTAQELTELQSWPLKGTAEVHQILSNSAISLKDALELLPRGMHVNLQILYPTSYNEKKLNFGFANSINDFCDAILSAVFDCARTIRERFPDAMRSIIFSSSNQTVCTALNWKQPNYPIFLNNDLRCESTFSDSRSSMTREIQSISVKEAVRIAKDNNFMGLFCSSSFLEMAPKLVNAIKSQGLVLLINKFDDADNVDEKPIKSSRLPEGIDGVLDKNGVLRFSEKLP
ncbi:putative ankyrin repeat protein nuc-2 [Erysiphe necator]|uniref:Putative ankyrin repeat protein nuc-2 n=1 Tax=Uncinula necator TaxID=52586 RepID=A0A0B1NVF2_UNCNE|nr:putative ankyrin repeat protein nuc-2 [Erysiphe necator]